MILGGLTWKDIPRLLCRQIISILHWLHWPATLNLCVASATSYLYLGGLKASWTWAVLPPCVCCSSAGGHKVYDVNIRPFMYNFCQPPTSAPSSCYAAAGSLSRSPANVSSPSSLPLLSSYFIMRQQNVCHIRSHAEDLLLLLLVLLPFPRALSLLCCLNELHSGYVTAKVKVSLPLSRET